MKMLTEQATGAALPDQGRPTNLRTSNLLRPSTLSNSLLLGDADASTILLVLSCAMCGKIMVRVQEEGVYWGEIPRMKEVKWDTRLK